MANRLDPINLLNFTGGLNLRRTSFQLAENESPAMLNVEVDPSGGVYSRKGWSMFTTSDIVAGDWDPRNAFSMRLSDGTQYNYIANQGTLLYGGSDAAFVDSGITVSASPHLADFASWGDNLYVACGAGNQAATRVSTSNPAVLTLATTGAWVDDYTAPTGGKLPSCDFFETHSGYLFAAGIDESGASFPNRLRWSHPNNPEDWAELDYIDIKTGGTKITGLLSFNDHLLIFKNNSVWALYGYNSDSWQLVRVSAQVGTPTCTGLARSENAAFFYSDGASKGIFGYGGDVPEEISEAVRPAFQGITAPTQVFMGWVEQRLWVSVPWGPETLAGTDVTDVFVFDPTFGTAGVNQAGLSRVKPAGAWVRHQSVGGIPGPYFGQEIDTTLACIRAGSSKGVMQVEAVATDSYDVLSYPDTLETVAGEDVEDLAGNFIAIVGSNNVVFETYYRTGWINGGWPTRKKSWRRPDFVCREFGTDYVLRIDAYRDLQMSAPRRSYDLPVTGSGVDAVWGDFDWGDGTQWGRSIPGQTIVRGKSFGTGKSLQLQIKGPTVRPAKWGVGAIVLKKTDRRFR